MAAGIGYVLTWDGVASSGISGLTVQKIRRRMVGGVRDVAVDMPGRDGAWLFTENRGMRDIVATCTVAAGLGSRHSAVVSVADWLDLQGYRNLIVDDQPDRYWRAYLADDPDPDEWRQKGTFDVRWRAEPYAWSVSTSSQCATATGASYSGSFTAADGIPADPEVVITPLNGTITSFDLTVNGDILSVGTGYTFLSGINVSSLSFTVTTGTSLDTDLTGAYDSNALQMSAVSGSFGRLNPGTNTWTLAWAGTATQVRVCFRWRRRYR